MQAILKRLYKLDPKLDCLQFKLNDSDKTNENLNLQPKIVDFISAKLNEMSLFRTSQNFPTELEDLNEIASEKDDQFNMDSLILNNNVLDSKIYDPIYILPNMYYLLDYGNIVDVVQFVNNRCLSYLFSALSLECTHLRSLAYGSLYRFSSHLESMI